MSISSATSGLGSFALNDDETRAYNAEIEAYEKSIGDVGGIADLGAIRARMEEMGRFGDDALAHVETGELVVPKPLLDKMPELKESILGHLRDMGVEDPERYIVGDGSNAINPETGALEFFFKSVFRGIKKAVKSVGKFLKKAAPTIITIAGAALLGPAGLGLSTLAAGAISSGIGTLVGGGSVKDALFSAAIGGVTAGIAPSIGDTAAGALGGMARSAVAGGDMEDILIGGATGAGGAALGKLAGPSVNKALGMKYEGGTLGEDLSKTSDFFTTASSDGLGAALQPSAKAFDTTFGTDFATPGTKGLSGDLVTPAPAPSENLAPIPVSGGDVDFGRVNVDIMQDGPGGFEAVGGTVDGQRFGVPAPTTAATGVPQDFVPPLDMPSTAEFAKLNEFTAPGPQTPGFIDRLTERPIETLVTGQPELTGAQKTEIFNTEYAKALKDAPANMPQTMAAQRAAIAADAAVKAAEPSFLARNPYLATVPLAAAPFMGSLMEVPEMEEPNLIERISPEEREAMVAANRLPPGALTATVTSPRQTRVPVDLSSQGFNQSLRDRFPELFAAEGGEVFPRRTGGIMPNEGIPGKDSVKALVMPGEFIFTTNAVKGAGNGDLQRGINNMYGVMRNLEARGARMA